MAKFEKGHQKVGGKKKGYVSLGVLLNTQLAEIWRGEEGKEEKVTKAQKIITTLVDDLAIGQQNLPAIKEVLNRQLGTPKGTMDIGATDKFEDLLIQINRVLDE